MLKSLVALLLMASPALAEMQEVRLGDRFYLIDLPAQAASAPIILALHGGGGSPEQFATSSGLGPFASRLGYAVIFPAGNGRLGDKLLTWNAGYCCAYAMRTGVDDVAFLTTVIADASARFGLDGTRVYLTGMSNGSMMSELYAAKLPNQVKAVAAVSGTMDVANTRAKGPVPLLIIHGTADANVPYEGGVGDSSFAKVDFASVDDVANAFLARWSGKHSVKTRQLDAVDDGTSVTITDHLIAGRVVLRVERVEGGGHYWPGSVKARLKTGKTQEITANIEMLHFFALHP